jgi:hypothetical protein
MLRGITGTEGELFAETTFFLIRRWLDAGASPHRPAHAISSFTWREGIQRIKLLNIT